MPDWDFNSLESLIQDRGDEVVVETGVACPCRNSDSFASMVKFEGTEGSVRKINCNKCQGDGFIFRQPRVVTGLVVGIKPGNKSLIDAGYAMPGDCTFSPSLGAFPMGDGDRVTFTIPSFIGEGQVIFRGAANRGQNATTDHGLAANEDRLYYQTASSIWCEDENGVVYSEGGDFILEDRLIRWVGNKPIEGVLYTLKYCGYLEWIVYDIPQQRFDRARDLAQKVILRKKHVAFSTGSNADTPEKRDEEFRTRTII